MRVYNYDIVFREIPDEASLALLISGCRENCKFCHSPQLKLDVGDILDEEFLEKLISQYGFAVSTILFMGGEHAQEELIPLVEFVKEKGFKAA